jgi:Protein of unknown function (DUF3592)
VKVQPDSPPLTPRAVRRRIAFYSFLALIGMGFWVADPAVLAEFHPELMLMMALIALGMTSLLGLFAAGLFLVREGVRAFADRRRWIEDGVLVEGQVVGFEPRPQTEGPDEVAPIVSYRDNSGHAEQFTSAREEWPNVHTVGQNVPVRYLASDPKKVELDSVALARTFVVYAVPAVILLACAAMLLLYMVYMLWHWWRWL